MRGASADSLRTLTDTLDRLVEGGRERSEEAGRLGDDLFAVAAVLRREPSLRRVATDLSLAPSAKSGLVRRLFEGQVGDASLGLVADAVELRWAATRDLGDALEHLGVIAVVRGADEAGQADALEDELFGFGRLVEGSAELRDALSDPARSLDDKRALVRRLLEGRATDATVRLAEEALAGTHRTVSVAIAEYRKVAAQHRNRLAGTVRVARELTDEDRERLETALTDQYDRPVRLNVVVDPEVIGGLRVEIGDDVIDGTVASRLDDARRRLAG